MRSFEHKYFLDQPISHGLLALVRTLGEYKGRQDLYQKQSPQDAGDFEEEHHGPRALGASRGLQDQASGSFRRRAMWQKT